MNTKIIKTLGAYGLVSGLGALGAVNPGFAAGSHSGGHGMAFGAPGDAKAVTRTIEVIVTDHVFDLPEITVKDGETVRFVIHNKGEFIHEFNIGTAEVHAEHQAEMIMMMEHGMMTPTSFNHSMVNMDHSQMAMAANSDTGGMVVPMKHDDPNSVLLEPGDTREIVWAFKHAGDVEFACNVPGHYESGMMGELLISK